MLSCQYCEILHSIYFEEHVRTAAFEKKLNLNFSAIKGLKSKNWNLFKNQKSSKHITVENNNRNTRKRYKMSLKLTIKTLERHQHKVAQVPLLITLNRFHTVFWCFHCWLWTRKCRLGTTQPELKVYNTFVWQQDITLTSNQHQLTSGVY